MLSKAGMGRQFRFLMKAGEFPRTGDLWGQLSPHTQRFRGLQIRRDRGGWGTLGFSTTFLSKMQSAGSSVIHSSTGGFFPAGNKSTKEQLVKNSRVVKLHRNSFLLNPSEPQILRFPPVSSDDVTWTLEQFLVPCQQHQGHFAPSSSRGAGRGTRTPWWGWHWPRAHTLGWKSPKLQREEQNTPFLKGLAGPRGQEQQQSHGMVLVIGRHRSLFEYKQSLLWGDTHRRDGHITSLESFSTPWRVKNVCSFMGKAWQFHQNIQFNLEKVFTSK